MPKKRVNATAPVVLRRAQKIVAGLWKKATPPHLVGRLEEKATMADAGAAALVFSATAPDGVEWGVVPFHAFARAEPAPIITEKTSWRATENGNAVPHSLQTVPSIRLHDWEQEMTRVHLPSEDNDRQ